MTDLNPTLSFPPMPANADKNIIKPAHEFKKSINAVIGAIALFILMYILLLVASLAIALAAGWLGVFLISYSLHNLIALPIGIGLILSGLMLAFFLIKFIFAESSKEAKGYEIKEKNYPDLFVFINRVADEVGTSHPKHVYIISEANAAAHLQPSFLSFFSPGKKDLILGLGLITSLNKSEFKALLAHEFGHFSQRSMRIGTYVDSLNRALYNLLYENKGYKNVLNTWSKLHWTLRFSAVLNAYAISGMQNILRKLYFLINKRYMQFSRESEFHADAIAAYASGSNNVITLLRKLDISKICYNNAMELVNVNFLENRKVANFYDLQSRLLKWYARENKLILDEADLPIVAGNKSDPYTQRLRFDDPWASHPSLGDREKYLNSYQLNSDVITQPAWLLFENAERLQKVFTERLYQYAEPGEAETIISGAEMEESFLMGLKKNSYDERYNGFYDNRYISSFGIEETIFSFSNNEKINFTCIFNESNSYLPKYINALNADLSNLTALITSPGDYIRSFDYKGERYYVEDAGKIWEMVNTELVEKEKVLEDLDKMVFKLFYQVAGSVQKEILTAHYKKVFKFKESSLVDFENYNKLKNAMYPTKNRMKYTDIYNTLNNVYSLEREIKPRIKRIIDDENTKPFLKNSQIKILKAYLDNKLVYFLEPNYNNAAIRLFNNALDTYIGIINQRNFQFQTDLLDFQLTLDYAT